MEQKFKMRPWATDMEKDEFVIFMVDRGKDKVNAFVWVTPERDDRGAVMITTFSSVISYFSQAAEPMYFGDDRPEKLMEAAYKTLDEYPDNVLDEQIFRFGEEARRKETIAKKDPRALEFEKKSLERLAKDGKQGDGISAV